MNGFRERVKSPDIFWLSLVFFDISQRIMPNKTKKIYGFMSIPFDKFSRNSNDFLFLVWMTDWLKLFNVIISQEDALYE
jgi:hypothetical protein